MNDHIVLRVVTSVLFPFILLFAFYIQAHGEVSPGGGFQAGVILATACVLHALVFGLSKTIERISPRFLVIGAGLGILIYGGVGVVTMLLGGSYLDYSVLSSDSMQGQQLGIITIELGVAFAVASVMALLFYLFALRKE